MPYLSERDAPVVFRDAFYGQGSQKVLGTVTLYLPMGCGNKTGENKNFIGIQRPEGLDGRLKMVPVAFFAESSLPGNRVPNGGANRLGFIFRRLFMVKIITILFCAYLFISLLPGQDFKLVLLPKNKAFVQEQRAFPLQKGIQKVVLPSLPGQLDFSRFYIWPLTDGVPVNRIGRRPPSMSLETLLAHNVNKRIHISLANGQQVSGRLIEWFASGKRLYLRGEQNQPIFLELQEPYSISFEQDTVFFQSEDFYRPYFMEVESARKGLAKFELGYLVEDMDWQVSYAAFLNEKENRCRLMGWLQLKNNCGKDFSSARVSILIGEPRIYSDYSLWHMYVMRRFEQHLARPPVSSYGSFEEKNFTDFKLFSLKNTIPLPDNVPQKVILFPPIQVKVAKDYWLTVSHDKAWVEARLTIENRKENGLGFALPPGEFQVYKTKGTQKIYITSTEIGSIPALDRVQLLLGRVIDVKAWHRVTKKTPIGEDSLQVTYELEIRNFKTEPIILKLIIVHFEEEPVKILEIPASDYTLQNHELRFSLTLPARESRVVTYTVLEEKGF